MAEYAEYYAIVGLRETIDNPSGLIRYGGSLSTVRDRFNRSTLKWEHDGKNISNNINNIDNDSGISE